MHLPDLFYQNRPNTPTSWFDSYLGIELTRDPVPTYTFDKRLSDTGIESSIEGFRLYAVDSLLCDPIWKYRMLQLRFLKAIRILDQFLAELSLQLSAKTARSSGVFRHARFASTAIRVRVLGTDV